jgi:acyl carrier protein
MTTTPTPVGERITFDVNRVEEDLVAQLDVEDDAIRKSMKGALHTQLASIELIESWIREIDPSVDKLTADTKIFAQGLLSSVAVVSLVLKIEAHLRIELQDEDLEFENFASIQRIADTILTKYNPPQIRQPSVRET